MFVKSEEYIRGRLEGLFQLVSLLREIITEDEAKTTIVQRLVEHIYTEIEEILEQMGEEVNVKEKVSEIKKKDDVKEKVTVSYDVLSDLIQKRIGEQ